MQNVTCGPLLYNQQATGCIKSTEDENVHPIGERANAISEAERAVIEASTEAASSNVMKVSFISVVRRSRLTANAQVSGGQIHTGFLGDRRAGIDVSDGLGGGESEDDVSASKYYHSQDVQVGLSAELEVRAAVEFFQVSILPYHFTTQIDQNQYVPRYSGTDLGWFLYATLRVGLR